MIYLKIITEAIQDNLIIIGVGILGIISFITMFLPQGSKIKKIFTFITKK
tara:strand:- start:429 stop:578 length:150 start_codon:yes stop_codon:yes gene_type:complete